MSFDNVKVGKLQGKGLVAALKAKGMFSEASGVAELNGGITDNNAKLFKQGYDSVLNPLYKTRHVQEGAAGDQWTDWNPIKVRHDLRPDAGRNEQQDQRRARRERRPRGRRRRLAQGATA